MIYPPLRWEPWVEIAGSPGYEATELRGTAAHGQACAAAPVDAAKRVLSLLLVMRMEDVVEGVQEGSDHAGHDELRGESHGNNATP